MTSSMPLSEIRAIELNERIEDFVSSGDLESVDTLPDEVLVECARRYIAMRLGKRNRPIGRSREQVEKVKQEAKAVFQARVSRVTDSLIGELHKGWSATMLASDFALPNGNRVTWGNATIADHEARADQLQLQATSELETVAIHRSAIKDLRDARVSTLSELPA